MRNILVEFLNEIPIEEQNVELVERKGIGHPDSICDGLAEAMSRELSKEYIERFGRILHHNTDKVELVGGESNPLFGGGEVIKPIYILLTGRATAYVENTKVPVGKIVVGSARNYLRKNIKEIDIDSEVIIDQRLGQGSSDLRSVFGRKGMPKANDTSFGVGFAPLSLTEKLVLESEKYIHRMGIKACGSDIKVMGVRKNDEITLTVACAMISKYIKNLNHYVRIKEDMCKKLQKFVSKFADHDINIAVNTGDNVREGSVYLTVTGTSAEHGDDGSVGRGNRANGLITPYRPMSLEATAGKNPVNHIGKIYNVLANKIADDIAKEGATQVYVRLMSQIGKPIDQPLIASVQIIGDDVVKRKAYKITDYWLENITDLTEMFLKEKVSTF